MYRRIACALLLAACLAGCQGGQFGFRDEGNFIKPTIAVMKFENRAPFPLNWDLGGGMQDILVDRLVHAGRYQVVERAELDSVLRELRFQQTGATRRQSRASLGRIKNVRYLIKGTVTDFGHVSGGSGFLGLGGLELFGGGNRAVMGIIMYVVDVESGEIISSESIEESVRAGDTSIKGTYKHVSFGGSMFYRTPLGRATARVIDRAVKRITRSIAAQPWAPKVALVQEDGAVVINGGANRRVQLGQVYEVYEQGQPILNPDTGDILGRQKGKVLGSVRVCEVKRLYSTAYAIKGEAKTFRIGQPCRVAASTGKPPP